GVVVRGAPRGVGVDVVVVAHLLAVQLLGHGEPAREVTVRVERRTLVGVLAVAQHGRAVPGRTDPRGEARALVGRRDDVAHPARDRDVVGRGVHEGLRGEGLALGVGEAARVDGGDDVAVARGVDDDGDARVVLRRGADHRGPADVDLLDALVGARARGDR